MSLVVDKKDGVARVTLNRPDVRNAFDDALIASLTNAFAELDRDATIKVVVLAGNGPAFCAGADLNWMKRMAGYSYDENLRDARALAEMLAGPADRQGAVVPVALAQIVVSAVTNMARKTRRPPKPSTEPAFSEEFGELRRERPE